jgi:cohesin complex subunit SCC1
VDEPAEETPRKKKEKRKAKEKKQVIDAVTELNDGNDRRKANQNGLPFAKADVSNIITPPVYLPSSSMVMRYLEVRADPLSHFFPIKVTDTGSFYCVAPPGIAPEISDMFLFPAPQGAGQKRKGPGQDERATKRQRLGSEPIDEVEMPRLRAGSAALSAAGNFNEDHFGDGFAEESGFFPNDDTLPLDNVRFDVDDSLHLDKPPSSRHTTPGADLFDENVRVYADVDSLVAIFDTQPQTQDTTGPTSSQQPADDKEETTNKDGFGRNTLKAIGLLRNEFDALGSRKNKNLSFAQLTDKVINNPQRESM